MVTKLATTASIRVLFLVSVGYFLLVAPDKLYTNFAVMSIGYVVSPNIASGSEGWLGVLLILMAIEDAMRLVGPRPAESFLNVLPVRLLFLFFMFILCYYFKISALNTGPTFMYLFYDSILSGWCFLAAREQVNEEKKAIVRDSRGYAGQEAGQEEQNAR